MTKIADTIDGREAIILNGSFHTVDEELPINAMAEIVDGYLWIHHEGQDINTSELFPLVNLSASQFLLLIGFAIKEGFITLQAGPASADRGDF